MSLALPGLTPNDRFLHHVPVNHVSGATELGASPIIAGATQVIIDQFHPVVSLEQMETQGDYLRGCPYHVCYAIQPPNFKDYDLSAIRFCMVGSHGTKDILAKMKEITPYSYEPYGYDRDFRSYNLHGYRCQR